jgi:hypothetical protein
MSDSRELAVQESLDNAPDLEQSRGRVDCPPRHTCRGYVIETFVSDAATGLGHQQPDRIARIRSSSLI